jgi:hypothetical protein
MRHPLALASGQDAEIIDRLLHDASEGKFLTKGKLLNEIEKRYGKTLTHRWVNRFIARHQDAIACATVYRQENPR